MPLLDIVGVNSVGRSFYVGFAFLPSEREDAYSWALRCLQAVYDEYDLGYPLTVFTDKEKALLNALTAILPSTAVLLCLWHVNSNIKAQAKPAIGRFIKSLIEAKTVERKDYAAEVAAFWKKMLQR
jgi:histone-lysine N-methyltransferase SETD2